MYGKLLEMNVLMELLAALVEMRQKMKETFAEKDAIKNSKDRN